MMPTPTCEPKRIVLHHESGLFQILAVTLAQPDPIINGRYHSDRGITQFSLVAAKPRYYLFRPVGRTPTKPVPTHAAPPTTTVSSVTKP